jgi:hypothetical protein
MANNTAMANDSNVDTILTLPERTGSIAVAVACRDAALAFIQESERWGKAELAMWLMGPYAQLTQYVPASGIRKSGEIPRAPMLREIDVRMVDRVIRSARAEILSTLETMRHAEGGASFAFTMMSAGFVVRCEDRGRISGWIPTAEARRLADRVLSLFAADYLTRSSDYETDLSICSHCKMVDFDALARARGVCHRHGGNAAPQSRRSTVPYLPEGA